MEGNVALFNGAPAELVGGWKDPGKDTDEVKITKIRERIEKAYANADGDVKSKQIFDYNENSTYYSALEVAEPVYNIGNLAKIYDENPYHAAAIDAKVDSIVGLGQRVDYSSPVLKKLEKLEKKDEDGEKKRKVELQLDDARDQLIAAIDSMNRDEDLFSLLQKVALDRFIMGNAYIEVGRNKLGEIRYIGHVLPHNMRIRKRRDGFVQMVNGKVTFFRNFGDRTTQDPLGQDPQPNEIIHFARYSPVDAYYGVPEITAALDAVAGIKFANRYNLDFFENNAVPRYVIKTKGINLTPAQQENLLKFFETTIKGVSHRTVVVPIPGSASGMERDIDFVPVATTRQEGHFVQYIAQAVQSSLARHRVPQSRVAITSAATSSAESREAEKTFKETVCRPEQRMIEGKLNKLIAELTDLFEFRIEEYTLTDEDTQSQINERGIRMGWITPDEIRIKEGKGPRPDGNGNEALDQRSLLQLQLENQMKLQKEAAKAAEKAAAAAPQPSAGEDPTAQRRAEDKAQAYQTRTRDQNRQADTPDKNPNNRNGRRSAGEGRHPNK